ncbi:hypothetical protein LTR10_002941 [Elasticomyces elasticus]|nr:hypothetical protein LTR10_002941 [Elasticomyces elasticus]KAK4967720.1 hypothetical protein LTR42_010047 [Elasticomyces elasticus]
MPCAETDAGLITDQPSDTEKMPEQHSSYTATLGHDSQNCDLEKQALCGNNDASGSWYGYWPVKSTLMWLALLRFGSGFFLQFYCLWQATVNGPVDLPWWDFLAFTVWITDAMRLILVLNPTDQGVYFILRISELEMLRFWGRTTPMKVCTDLVGLSLAGLAMGRDRGSSLSPYPQIWLGYTIVAFLLDMFVEMRIARELGARSSRPAGFTGPWTWIGNGGILERARNRFSWIKCFLISTALLRCWTGLALFIYIARCINKVDTAHKLWWLLPTSVVFLPDAWLLWVRLGDRSLGWNLSELDTLCRWSKHPWRAALMYIAMIHAIFCVLHDEHGIWGEWARLYAGFTLYAWMVDMMLLCFVEAALRALREKNTSDTPRCKVNDFRMDGPDPEKWPLLSGSGLMRESLVQTREELQDMDQKQKAVLENGLQYEKHTRSSDFGSLCDQHLPVKSTLTWFALLRSASGCCMLIFCLWFTASHGASEVPWWHLAAGGACVVDLGRVAIVLEHGYHNPVFIARATEADMLQHWRESSRAKAGVKYQPWWLLLSWSVFIPEAGLLGMLVGNRTLGWSVTEIEALSIWRKQVLVKTGFSFFGLTHAMACALYDPYGTWTPLSACWLVYTMFALFVDMILFPFLGEIMQVLWQKEHPRACWTFYRGRSCSCGFCSDADQHRSVRWVRQLYGSKRDVPEGMIIL